jgi:hypothetical protein
VVGLGAPFLDGREVVGTEHRDYRKLQIRGQGSRWRR